MLVDIVFCRTWYKVDVQQFYTPITTLLLPPDKKNSWKGIRTKGELKRQMNIRSPAEKDSLYKVRIFLPIRIVRLNIRTLFVLNHSVPTYIHTKTFSI